MKHIKRSPTTPAARQSAVWCRVSPFVSPPFQAQGTAGTHLLLLPCPADLSRYHWEDPRVGNPLRHVTAYVRVAVTLLC